VVSEFIRDPSKVLLAYLGATEGVTAERKRWFEYGVVAVALEVITQIRALEAIPMSTEYGTAQAVSALHTLLTEMDLSIEAHELYEQLSRWRRPAFVPGASRHEPSRLEIVSAEPEDRASRSDDSASAS
jgi:hypothetical protein